MAFFYSSLALNPTGTSNNHDFCHANYIPNFIKIQQYSKFHFITKIIANIFFIFTGGDQVNIAHN